MEQAQADKWMIGIVRNIIALAVKFGWKQIDHQKDKSMISFRKDEDRINIYYSKPWRMTVATTITHPTWGRKQLFRRNIKMPELETILRYPRKHTGKGYYRKDGKIFNFFKKKYYEINKHQNRRVQTVGEQCEGQSRGERV